MPDVYVPKLEGHGPGKTALNVIYEPRLLEMYDAILPKIDAALGEKK